MLLFDVNIFVYALSVRDARHHEALDLVESALSGPEAIGWHPLTGSAALRITTNAKLYERPCTAEECFRFFDTILSAPIVRSLHEDLAFWQTFEALVRKYLISGPAITDAYIAALAIANDATLISSDRGFSRMTELSWRKF